jgi:hypothetical protein
MPGTHSVCYLVRIGTLPPPLPEASGTKGGGDTLACGGEEVPNWTTGEINKNASLQITSESISFRSDCCLEHAICNANGLDLFYDTCCLLD